MIRLGEGVTRFADENNAADLWGREDFVDFGEVLVGGFVATTDDDDKIVIRKGIDGDACRGWVGRKIIVVKTDAIDFAEKFETVRQAVKGCYASSDGVGVFG